MSSTIIELQALEEGIVYLCTVSGTRLISGCIKKHSKQQTFIAGVSTRLKIHVRYSTVLTHSSALFFPLLSCRDIGLARVRYSSLVRGIRVIRWKRRRRGSFRRLRTLSLAVLLLISIYAIFSRTMVLILVTRALSFADFADPLPCDKCVSTHPSLGSDGLGHLQFGSSGT